MFVVLNGVTFQIDAEDWARLRHKSWRAYVSALGRTVVVRQEGSRKTRVKNIYIQHEILGADSGSWIDHRNRDTADNRKANLRVCTPAQNAANRPGKRCAVIPYKGVSRVRKRFTARIKHSGRIHCLGGFPTAEEAAHAYDTAARELYGEFAWLNSVHGALSGTERERHHG